MVNRREFLSLLGVFVSGVSGVLVPRAGATGTDRPSPLPIDEEEILRTIWALPAARQLDENVKRESGGAQPAVRPRHKLGSVARSSNRFEKGAS
jgi:hypothetical protein